MHDMIIALDETDQPVDLGHEDAGAAVADDAADVPQVPAGFEVVDAASASWACRKINEARAHARRSRAWADREIARARRDEERLMFLFGRQLQEFAEREIAKLKGRRRSVCLPGGTLAFRRTGPTLVFDDPEMVLAWAKANCADAVVVKEQVSKSMVNRHVESTGEIPDGAHIDVGRDRFLIG
jgi:hypothetical protein